MGRHAGTLTAEHRATLREKALRVWADPALRAQQIEAMRQVGAPTRAAILAACLAEPKRPYKSIAHQFRCGESTVGAILRAAGVRRSRPYRRNKLKLQAAE